MKYTKLGRSGMVVSRICMGTHHLDAPEQMDRHVENVLYAWSKGVNFFETGTTYGEGFSEQILGQAFAQMKKGELPFHVMSKTHAGEPSDFRRDLENSLKRLGLEQIDVFTCLWGVKSGVEYDEAKAYGALEEMEKARQEGLIRHIGVSAHMKNAEMAHLAQDFSFDIIEEGFNVVNARYRMEGLKASYESGAGVVAMNPLSTGDIFRFPEMFDAIRIREGLSLAQSAYLYSLSVPYAHCVLGTFNNKDQIDEALAVLEEEPYSGPERDQVQKQLSERIEKTGLNERITAGKALRQRPYMLREEAADLMQVYPLSC